MTERTTIVEDGVTYIVRGDFKYAKCCGRGKCTSECKAVIHHGPGHQSRSHCEVEGPHEQHYCEGPQRQDFFWSGDEGYSKYTWSYDESPEEEK